MPIARRNLNFKASWTAPRHLLKFCQSSNPWPTTRELFPSPSVHGSSRVRGPSPTPEQCARAGATRGTTPDASSPVNNRKEIRWSGPPEKLSCPEENGNDGSNGSASHERARWLRHACANGRSCCHDHLCRHLVLSELGFTLSLADTPPTRQVCPPINVQEIGQ